MANHASALKRARQDAKIRALHRAQKSAMRTAIKKVQAAVDAGDREAAAAAFREASSLIARAGRKRLIHPRQAARRVSRLNAKIKSLD